MKLSKPDIAESICGQVDKEVTVRNNLIFLLRKNLMCLISTVGIYFNKIPNTLKI